MQSYYFLLSTPPPPSPPLLIDPLHLLRLLHLLLLQYQPSPLPPSLSPFSSYAFQTMYLAL